jgi:hypothetical protein
MGLEPCVLSLNGHDHSHRPAQWGILRMSMEHMHASLQGIFPAKGDGLTTNQGRPILML